MKIEQLVQSLEQAGLLVQKRIADDTAPINKISVDSRKISAGDLFIAYKGVASDGHAYIETALRQGATLVILEDASFLPQVADHSHILVKDSREAWAYAEALYYDNPHLKMKFIGVTGTNGKTSSVWMIRQILDNMNVSCMGIGTLGIQLGASTFETSHTTPDPDILFQKIAQAVGQGVKVVAMEVSSHSLEQRKLGPIRFHVAGFTSFSQDHLDYHQTMDHYLAAKKLLFSDYLIPSGSVICLHESVAPLLADMTFAASLCVYGEGNYTVPAAMAKQPAFFSRFHLENVTPAQSHVVIDLNGTKMRSAVSFFGNVFLGNLLGAVTMATQLVERSVDERLLSSLRPVPGRLEPVRVCDQQPGVFVDYAHTPDALEKVLKIAREFCRGHLWVIFGCGGDRDRKKRPLMAQVAEAVADEVVVTSDNPRTEVPEAIVQEIVTGFKKGVPRQVIVKREEAISYAVKHAKVNDLIIVAGKGHEDYQIIGKTKIHFDDREVAARYLKEFWSNQ
jgi:UDP-N-acetylmuramoyl-L-alanyl-D-glutamate--2,6-diaminopimelate ligase